jgi:hypothetical protein
MSLTSGESIAGSKRAPAPPRSVPVSTTFLFISTFIISVPFFSTVVSNHCYRFALTNPFGAISALQNQSGRSRSSVSVSFSGTLGEGVWADVLAVWRIVPSPTNPELLGNRQPGRPL